ncbi:T9SS type A sorting domain-containing protein, partial [Crocinitomix algicola]|uniref:T9SS type A sorting domain-containing protein n=1 Tax=Crocinitomix algicola TaxID=1740263 RepID=UPI000AF477CE
LNLEDGGSVDLAPFMDNTDNQNLTAATLTGTVLEIEIEGGTSVSVDLSSLLADIQAQLDDHEERITAREECECGHVGISPEENEGFVDRPILYQNIPNPFNNTSMIKYYIPQTSNNGNLVISDNMGQIISMIELNDKGYGSTHVNAEGLAPGPYYYTLYVDEVLIDTKIMIVQ